MAPRYENPSEDWQVNCPAIHKRTEHLLRSREWADCSFQFEQETGADAGAEDSTNSLKAHKLILAMASPVFAAMFYGNVGDKENPVIINDIDLPTFSALLEYLYTDEAKITDAETAMNLYKAAHKYILVDLKKRCLSILFQYLFPTNACHIYEFACVFGERVLENKCLEMFRTKTQEVLEGSSFRNADTNTVKKIVTMDTLNINNEMALFNALLYYADNFKKPDDDAQNSIYLSEMNMEHQNADKQRSNEVTIKNNNSRRLEKVASHSSKTKAKKDRKILQGIIEEIRFLSMTPADLARICESTTILTKDEKLALFTNAFSPNSLLPMPQGFSCIRQPRNRVLGLQSGPYFSNYDTWSGTVDQIRCNSSDSSNVSIY